MRQEIVCTNPDAPVNFHYSKVPTSSYVTPHWHDSLEFIYVLKGLVTVEFPSRKVDVNPGEFVVINSAQVHSVDSLPNEALVLQVPLDFLKKYVDDCELMTFTVSMHPETEKETEALQYLKQIFRDMYDIYKSRPEGYLLRFHSLLYQFLFELVRSYSGKRVRSEYETESKYLTRLETMKRYLDEHHAEAVRVSDLAGQMGYNEDYLSRVFKRYMGMSIVTYLYEIRIGYVMQDLIHTDAPVQDIFEKHGCSNLKLAKRLFRERFHGTPREVRKYMKDMDQSQKAADGINVR